MAGPDPTNSQPPAAPDPLTEIAGPVRPERLGPERRTPKARALILGAFRACCAGVFLGGFIPTVVVLTAWVGGVSARMSSSPDPDTPLGRDPVRWRVEQYLRHFPLDSYPLGFAVGFLAWCAVEVARWWVPDAGRMQPRTRALLVVLVIAYLGTVGIEWYLAQPPPRDRGPYKYDPIEDDPAVQPILRAAGREAEEAMKGVPRTLGFGPAYSQTKKAILKQKYGIDWRTPSEMNPKMVFE